MSLFKYFEEGAKDGLPDPNGPLSSRVSLDKSVGQPKGIWGLSEYVSSKSAASEGKKRGPYNRSMAIIATQRFMPVARGLTRHG